MTRVSLIAAAPSINVKNSTMIGAPVARNGLDGHDSAHRIGFSACAFHEPGADPEVEDRGG
jgi:hypothetical protein